MSKFFIAVGTLIILVLFTALIGPYFVDWTSYRDSFEREATSYIGRPVTVAGKASVRLLPTPVVSFTDIRVGDADAPDVEMERFRAEVELAPLLKGEVRVIQMAVERPRFYVDVARLVSTEGNDEGRWRLDAERISLERLEIVGGSAAIRDSRTGRTWEAEGIDAVVEADTLMGPAKITAALIIDGIPVDLTAGLGRLSENGSITAKLAIHSSNYPVALALDGIYNFPGAEPGRYDGVATIEGVPPSDAAQPRSPFADFRGSGNFQLTPAALEMEEVQVTYGAVERPLILVASGALDLGDEPRFDLSIGARQIDIDRTLGGGADQPVSIEAAIAAVSDALRDVELPPLPGEVHLEAQGVVVGGGVIQAVGIDLSTAADAWRVDSFAAMLPGETRLDLDGALEVGSAPTFRGHVRLASARPAAFAAWWRGEAGSAGLIGRFAVEADLDLEAGNQRVTNLVATTGAGSMTGSVEVRRFPQSDKLFVSVDLGADRADLVEARALAELLTTKTIAAGTIDQMTLSLRADVLTAGGVEARSVEVEGGVEEGQLNLRRLSVADLAGARIDALGSIRDPLGKPSGRIEASIEAADFSGAAEFLVSFAPENRIARHLKSVAPILSPVSAEVSAQGGASDEKLALSLTGSFAGTHVTLEAEGDGSLDDLATLQGTLKLHADAGDSVEVLRQIGLTPLPIRSAPLRVDADFSGALASAGRLTLKGSIAGIDVDYVADTSLQDGSVALSGALAAETADIDPLLLLAGVALPGLGEGHPAAASGRLDYSAETVSLALSEASFAGQKVGGALKGRFTPNVELSGTLDVEQASLPYLVGLAAGAEPDVETTGWTDKPFSSTLPPGTAIKLSLTTASLDLGAPQPATQAQLDFALEGNELLVDLTEAGFAGGSLKGALSATIRGGEVDVSLHGGLSGGDLQSLVWEHSGLPAASGKIEASFDVTGRGRSVAGIVSTLNGIGSFSIDEGRLNSLNADALAMVMAAAEGEEQPDEAKARETFAHQFGSGALEFGRAPGSFSILDGVMTIPTVSLAGGATTILAEAKLDLNELALSSEWTVRSTGAGEAETQPYVQLRFSGPIASPDRRVELTPLLNLLQNRFTQIQLDKIQEAELRNAERERQRAAADQEAAANRRDLEPPAALPLTLRPAVSAPNPNPSPSRNPDPASIEIGPDLPPPRSRAPIQLVPPLLPPPQQAVQPEYRTLPNGTIVKIR